MRAGNKIMRASLFVHLCVLFTCIIFYGITLPILYRNNVFPPKTKTYSHFFLYNRKTLLNIIPDAFLCINACVQKITKQWSKTKFISNRNSIELCAFYTRMKILSHIKEIFGITNLLMFVRASSTYSAHNIIVFMGKPYRGKQGLMLI